jgi:hypothetical protein
MYGGYLGDLNGRWLLLDEGNGRRHSNAVMVVGVDENNNSYFLISLNCFIPFCNICNVNRVKWNLIWLNEPSNKFYNDLSSLNFLITQIQRERSLGNIEKK